MVKLKLGLITKWLTLLVLTLMLSACLGNNRGGAPTNFTQNVEAAQYITPRVTNIVNSSNNIDTIVENSPLAPPVRVETDKIRNNAEELSYERVNKLYASYGVIINKLQNQIRELQEGATREVKILLVKLSVGLTLLSALLLFLKQRELSGVSAGLAVIFFGASQVYGLWWVEIGLGIILLGSLLYLCYTLWKKRNKEECGEIVFGVLEKVYKGSTGDEQLWMDTHIFSQLSRKMDERHKIVVRELELEDEEERGNKK